MKKRRIELEYNGQPFQFYVVKRLVNLATFSTRKGGPYMIGSEIHPAEVEQLVHTRDIEVVITQAKS